MVNVLGGGVFTGLSESGYLADTILDICAKYLGTTRQQLVDTGAPYEVGRTRLNTVNANSWVIEMWNGRKWVPIFKFDPALALSSRALHIVTPISNYAASNEDIVSNRATTGVITVTIPSASDGLYEEFIVEVPNNMIVYSPDPIQVGQFAAYAWQSNVVGSTLKLFATQRGWYAVGVQGSWSSGPYSTPAGSRSEVGSAVITVISSDISPSVESSGAIFSNRDATKSIAVYLPEAIDGIEFDFLVESPEGLDIYFYPTGWLGSVSVGFLRSVEVGSSLRLISTINGWYTRSAVGTWSTISGTDDSNVETA